MESPQISVPVNDYALRWVDRLFLLALCALLFGFSLVQPRVFTTHETTHCLNVREMFESGDFLIPTYGGRPWLERPPAPHWLTGVFAIVAGDLNREWTMRLGSIFIATLAVFVLAWAVAGCFGRTIGVMSGAILATMREFAAYAAGTEADIFLASTVTICGALLLRLQFAGPLLALRAQAPESEPAAQARDCFPEPAAQARERFFGKRPWTMLLFFALLGLTNWMKGPLFGMIFIVLPLAGYLAWSRDSTAVKRFAWFWGWLVMAAIGAAWPILAYLRYPDIVELWAVDYGVRWQSGYIGEPFWYYLVNQPWNLFPWTIPAFAGLVATWKRVIRDANPGIRFVWCWALLPVVFFSLFKGKHHHYLLSCLAPAAVLGAFGSIALWKWIAQWPRLLQSPWLSLVTLGLPGCILVLWFGKKVPGPEWVQSCLLVGWPVVAFSMCWAVSRRNGASAFAVTCAIVVAVNCLSYAHRSLYMDSYVADREFVAEVKEKVDRDRPLLVINDEHPLNSSWLLFYLGERSRLLHNRTFLRDDRIDAPIVYVVCRQRNGAALSEYGNARLLTQSGKARGETSPDDRWTLYELRFHPHLARMPGDVRISPMQATGRKRGPFLGGEVVAGP